MTAAVAKRPGLQSTASQDPLERPSALATEACRGVRRLVMVQSPLAFDFSKTRTICDAFDGAWAFLQGDSSDITEPSKSLATRNDPGQAHHRDGRSGPDGCAGTPC